jgi:hypothetical protein
MEIIQGCLAENESCDIILERNPLPKQLMANPREFLRTHSKDKHVMALSTSREKVSILLGNDWRDSKLEKIRLSLSSIEIMQREAHRAYDEDDLIENNSSGRDQGFSLSEVWQKSNIERSEYYLSIDKMNNWIRDVDIIYTKNTIPVDVCFGRSTFVIGRIIIDSVSTYHDLVESIRPHILEYARTVDNDQLDEFLNYYFVDIKGNARIPEDEIKVSV